MEETEARTRVVAILSEARDELLRRWLEDVMPLRPAAAIPAREVLDEVPALVDAMLDHLRRGEPVWTAELEATARVHAEHRLDHRYELRTVVREYSLLRRRLIDPFTGVPAREQVPLVALRPIDELIDEAAAASVEHFAAMRRQTLEALLAERVKALRARDEVLAVVSHDLRNPLSAIRLSAASLHRRLVDFDDARALRQVQNILRSSERMERLVGDLLDLGRMQVGQLRIDLQRRSITELLENAIEIEEPSARDKGIVLTRAFGAERDEVLCDPDRIEQLAGNLLANAIKVCGPGDRVTVGVEDHDGELLVSIRDTGPGIPPETLASLFASSLSVDRPGRSPTGLGLYIARGIVDAHGGRMWAESEVGQGSVFYFTLRPAARAAEP